MILRYTQPPLAPTPQAPSLVAALFAQWRTPLELPRLLLARERLRATPRGQGPVVLFPGFKAPEAAMEPVRRYLAWLGYIPQHWGLGVNHGRMMPDREHMLGVLAQLHRAHGPVALVGWSLGGVLAREIARQAPELISQVVSYGSPVVGGPSFTFVARFGDPKARARAAQRQAKLDRERPIQSPMTLIFSRRDELVHWPACIDRSSPRVEHVEVGSTHMGMGLDPDVWQVVAESLGAPKGHSTRNTGS